MIIKLTIYAAMSYNSGVVGGGGSGGGGGAVGGGPGTYRAPPISQHVSDRHLAAGEHANWSQDTYHVDLLLVIGHF